MTDDDCCVLIGEIGKLLLVLLMEGHVQGGAVAMRATMDHGRMFRESNT